MCMFLASSLHVNVYDIKAYVLNVKQLHAAERYVRDSGKLPL